MLQSQPTLPPRGRRALFLDFDGTLVDIAPRPDAVHVPDDLGATLLALKAALDGALAIVTGRRIVDIDAMLGHVDIAIAGVHGSEVRWSLAGPVSTPSSRIDRDVIHALEAVAARVAGAWVEDKGTALSVHYRDVAHNDVEALSAGVNAAIGAVSGGLAVHPGRKVFEIVAGDVSKAFALEALMRSPPFAGRVPIMVGDDHADDAAMRAACRMGGLGLGVAGEYFAREVATFPNPTEVREWLRRQINEETT